MPLQSDPESEKKVMAALTCRGGDNPADSEAGWKLMESSPFVLPAIEKIITNILEPAVQRNSNLPDAYPGIDFVFCAYYLIQFKEEKLDRAIDFLRQRSPKLLVAAISALPSFYQIVDFELGDSDGALIGAIPANELKEFVQELTRHEEPDLRYTAEKILHLTNWPR